LKRRNIEKKTREREKEKEEDDETRFSVVKI
jgi:hypothetical protein